MLKLQAADMDDPALTRHLEDAAYRVSAVAKAHERINQGDGTDRLDFGIYIEQVCRDLNEVVTHCTIEIEAEHGIDILTDRAIPIALIANELPFGVPRLLALHLCFAGRPVKRQILPVWLSFRESRL